MTAGRVLVVDSDYDTLQALADAIRALGHSVTLATDGRSGLQNAVETSADVILVDREVKVFDIRTFLDVLRDNPRTSGAATLVMGRGDLTHLAAIDGRAEPIVKPFHASEIAARVDAIIRRRKAPAREAELRGDLSQVALWDLLQVFAANQRTGRLRVEADGAAGDIWLREGRVVDATQGLASGEKAFHRIIAFETGSFHFVPSLTRAETRLKLSTEMLIMEAARRLDETRRLREVLPSFGTTLGLASSTPIPPGTTAEIALALDEPRSIEELLDVLPHHDLEILQAISDLLASKCVVVEDEHAKLAFCDTDESPALRAAALRLRRGGAEGTARIGVVSSRGLELGRFARALGRVREFMPSSESPLTFKDQWLGSLGTVRIAGTDVELLALPWNPALRSLWGAMLSASTTLIVLGDSSGPESVDGLVRDLDLRMVRSESGHERPPGAIAVVRHALGVSGGRAYAAPR
jgi:CheY-like chemotaxis protein